MDQPHPEDDAAAPAAVDDYNADWRARPFARTFDLISQEYGWTDDEILNLTLARMRQIRDVVMIRQGVTWRRTVGLEEVKARTLVGAVHAAAGNAKGAKAAQKIAFMEPDENERKVNIPNTAAVSKMFPIDPMFGLISDDEIQAEIERLKREE